VSLVVAINQFSFAFGPTLLGQLQHARGSYGTALLVCLAMQAMAAITVVSPCYRAMPLTARSGPKRAAKISRKIVAGQQ
jgi:hypothetical protein